MISSTGKMNYFSLKDADVDRLIAQQRVTTDPQERHRLLGELQSIVYREEPIITLYYEDQLWATRANVHDVKVYVNEFGDFSRAWKR